MSVWAMKCKQYGCGTTEAGVVRIIFGLIAKFGFLISGIFDWFLLLWLKAGLMPSWIALSGRKVELLNM